MPTGGPPSAPWAPLRHELFRILWLASVASHLATWMQNAAAGWLLATLTTSALPVALLQTATSLPFLLVGLPAGALADRVPRRLVLVGSHLWLALSAAVLAGLSAAGAAPPWAILAATFAMGIGIAVNNPASLATMADVVPRVELAGAVTLTSAAINLARAAGPPVAGVIVAVGGAGPAFGLDAVLFLSVAAVLWRAPLPGRPAGHRHGGASFRAVLRVAAYRAVLVRSAAFIVGASALWALLPVIAVRRLGLGADGLGLLMGLHGAGALLGALLLAPLRARSSTDVAAWWGSLVFAGALAALALTGTVAAAGALMLPLGASWIAMRSLLSTAAQLAVPARVRGRAVAVLLLIFNAGMASGSVLWAAVADRWSLSVALLAAGSLIACGGLAAARGYRLVDDEVPSWR